MQHIEQTRKSTLGRRSHHDGHYLRYHPHDPRYHRHFGSVRMGSDRDVGVVHGSDLQTAPTPCRSGDRCGSDRGPLHPQPLRTWSEGRAFAHHHGHQEHHPWDGPSTDHRGLRLVREEVRVVQVQYQSGTIRSGTRFKSGYPVFVYLNLKNPITEGFNLSLVALRGIEPRFIG